jgi:hypothetical protein
MISAAALIALLVDCRHPSDPSGTENTPGETSPTGPRSGKAITAFIVAGVAGIINESNHTITVTVPSSTSLAGLTPVVTVSAGASYSPTGPQNFAVPVVYTVTAEDGLSQQYTVTVYTVNYTYSREYWGEWVRIDTGDTWYINSGAIKINGGAASGYTFAPKALTDKVISVNNGAFYLYASRAATVAFTGKITGVDPGSGPVHGVITTPKGKSYQFTTQPYAGDLYRATVTVPWSAEPYLAALIGADINKEAFYSLGFGEAADTVMSLENLQNYGGGGLLNYEPNDTEAAATEIDDGGRVVSYLTSLYPYDYYRVSLAGKQPVYDRLFIRSAQPVEYTGSNNDGNLNPGDTVALDLLLYNNYSSPVSADLTLTATGNKSAYITIEKGTAQVSGISSKYYATLTSYQSSAEDGVSFFSGYHPQNYFRFKVDENCPLGDLTFQVGFAAPGLTWYKDLTFQVLDRNRDIAAGTHTLVDTVSGDVNNRDGSANAGEGFGITIPVSNTGSAAVSGLQAALSSTSAYAVIDQSTVNIGTLSAGGAVTAAFHFTIDAQCRDSVLPFRITFTDNGSLGYTRTWWNTFSIPVAADPNIVINIDSHAIGYKTGGDDDGKIEAGETYYLDIKVVNAGTKMVNSLQAALSTASPLVSIMKGESAFLGASLNLNQYMSLTSTGASSNTNSIGLLQSARIDNAFVFAIAKNYPVGTDIVFTVSITYSGGFVDQTIRVPVAAPEKEDEGITVIGGADVDNQIAVNMSTTAPLSKSAGNSVTFTLTNTAQYQGWQWKRDGENAGTGPTLTLYANSLSEGTHYVSLIIRKDGLWYSKEYPIRVVN